MSPPVSTQDSFEPFSGRSCGSYGNDARITANSDRPAPDRILRSGPRIRRGSVRLSGALRAIGRIAIPDPAWRTLALVVCLCIATLGLDIRFCRWSRPMACRFSWIRAERRRSGAQSERESGGGYPRQGRLPGSSMHVMTDIRPDGPGARPVLHRSSGYAAAVLRRRAGQGWHEQIISESRQDSRPVAHGADSKVTEILIGPARPLLAAAVWS